MLFSAEVPKEPRCAQGHYCGVDDAPVTDARLQNPLGSCLVIGWIFVKIDFYRQFEFLT